MRDAAGPRRRARGCIGAPLRSACDTTGVLAGSIVAVTLVIGAASGLTVMQMRRSAWEQVGRVSQNLLEAAPLRSACDTTGV
jgi:hypothetical protein